MSRLALVSTALFLALCCAACGARTFQRAPEPGAGQRGGFEATEAEAAEEAEDDDEAEDDEMVHDATVDFDSEDGPFQEVE